MAQDEKKPPEERKDSLEEETITTYVHNMPIETHILIDGKIEVYLQKTFCRRAVLIIKSPKSVNIARNSKKY